MSPLKSLSLLTYSITGHCSFTKPQTVPGDKLTVQDFHMEAEGMDSESVSIACHHPGLNQSSLKLWDSNMAIPDVLRVFYFLPNEL